MGTDGRRGERKVRTSSIRHGTLLLTNVPATDERGPTIRDALTCGVTR